MYDLTAVNGTLIWNHVENDGTEDYPGIITLTGDDGGLHQVQQWFFLINEADTMLVYYCGTLMTWKFEGVLVMSKQPIMEPEDYARVLKALEPLGFYDEDLCQLDPQKGCKNAPKYFF
jgi:hypothetical protein